MLIGFARGALVLTVAAVLGACGGGGGGGNGNNPALTLGMAAPSGNGQADTIGAPLAAPLRVIVTEDGGPKDGETVTWTALDGGQVSSATSLTGADGVATMTWTLGTGLGAQSARAAVPGAAGSPVSFTATASAGLPALATKQSGDNQTTILSTAFGIPFSVKVTDRLAIRPRA